MSIKELEAVIEAILFTMGEAVEVERIAAVVYNYYKVAHFICQS